MTTKFGVFNQVINLYIINVYKIFRTYF